jgi:hypothetical protein
MVVMSFDPVGAWDAEVAEIGPPIKLAIGVYIVGTIEGIRAAKYTVDGGARGMREVFRSASWPPMLWA